MSDLGEFLEKPELRRLSKTATAIEESRARERSIWTPYLLGPDLEITEAGQYPAGVDGGIYILFEEDGALGYVGQSYGIGYRVVQHLWASQRGRLPKFTHFGAVDVPGWLMTDLETAYIHALDPPWNRLMPRVSWVHHDAAVAAIQELWGEKR